MRTPKDNPALERFNWTLQDEWLSVSEVGLDDIDEANPDLTNWLITYNNIRPHESLDYATPIEYATRDFKVSPMWLSSTPPGLFYCFIVLLFYSQSTYRRYQKMPAEMS